MLPQMGAAAAAVLMASLSGFSGSTANRSRGTPVGTCVAV